MVVDPSILPEGGEHLELASTVTITVKMTQRAEAIHTKESRGWTLADNPTNVCYGCLIVLTVTIILTLALFVEHKSIPREC